MTSIAAYDFAKSLLKNTYFSSFVVFAAWIAAITSGSALVTMLVILVGLVAYLRPLLLASLISRKVPAVKKPAKSKANFFSVFSFSPVALCLVK